MAGSILPSALVKDATKTAELIRGIISANKWGDGSKLTYLQRKDLFKALKALNNPNNGANAVGKIISSIGSTGAMLATNIGTAISTSVMPQEETKRRISANQKEISLAQIEAEKTIRKAALEAGLWNEGLNGNPNNSSGQQEGSNGNKGESKTPGSFLGG